MMETGQEHGCISHLSSSIPFSTQLALQNWHWIPITYSTGIMQTQAFGFKSGLVCVSPVSWRRWWPLRRNQRSCGPGSWGWRNLSSWCAGLEGARWGAPADLQATHNRHTMVWMNIQPLEQIQNMEWACHTFLCQSRFDNFVSYGTVWVFDGTHWKTVPGGSGSVLLSSWLLPSPPPPSSPPGDQSPSAAPHGVYWSLSRRRQSGMKDKLIWSYISYLHFTTY